MNTYHHTAQRRAMTRLHIGLVVVAAIFLFVLLSSAIDALSSVADGIGGATDNSDVNIVTNP